MTNLNPIIRSQTMKDYDHVMVAAEVNFPSSEVYTEFLRGVIADFECGLNGVIDHNTYTQDGMGYVTEVAFETQYHAMTEQVFQGPHILKRI